MKKSCIILKIVLLLVIFYATGDAQLLFKEDFSYATGDLVPQSTWTSIGTVNPIQVTSPGLKYPCYLESDIGNAVTLTGSGQDAKHTFAPITTGSVYVSAMVMVTAASSIDGDYVLSLGGIYGYNARIWIKKGTSTGLFNFGLEKFGPNPSWSRDFNINQTYLIVLKYTFVSGENNDQLRLYINPDVCPCSCDSCIEISPDTLRTTDTTDAISIDAIYLNQRDAALMPTVIIDGIRVATTWCDPEGAPCPVELSSFSSIVNGRDIKLIWETKTEKNSDKFVIQKKCLYNSSGWVTIGSIKAANLSNSTKKYSFIEPSLQSGSYQYRLKMIDNDGTFTYSAIVETKIDLPKTFELNQNFPNPFNPSTKINYSLPLDSKVILEVFNISGERIVQLVNTEQIAGYYSVDFNSSLFSKSLASGVYFYRINATNKEGATNFSSIKKMVFLK